MGTVPKPVHWRAVRICGRLQYTSALANGLHELEDYVHHL